MIIAWRIAACKLPETALRRILPLAIRFGATEWHPRPQWLLDAFDLDRGAERSFALQDVLDWNPPEASGREPRGEGT